MVIFGLPWVCSTANICEGYNGVNNTFNIGRRSTLEKPQEYREASRILIVQAHEELEKGDLRQVSEKGWGATAQILKAIGEERGLEHQSHGGIRRVLFRVSREELHEELKERVNLLFAVANNLHTNWYENWDSEETVSDGLSYVEELLSILHTSFPPQNRDVSS